MNDVCAALIPSVMDPSEILLVDIEEIMNVSSLISNDKDSTISFLDKLFLINKINNAKISMENDCKCAFIPFYLAKNIGSNDGETFMMELLQKISTNPPKITGHIHFTKRIVIETFIEYNVMVYFTEPIYPKTLKINKVFWCNKDKLKSFHNTHNYYNLGNELECLLPLRELNKYHAKEEGNLFECKLIPFSIKTSKYNEASMSLLHKIVGETKTDALMQNYVFADFMINSYPCEVMNYPQFIGFAVARGLYPKRLLKLFKALSDSNNQHISFENFLSACICMDMSTEHVNNTRTARGELIFKYYDRNNDGRLDFVELNCMIKRMRKKMGYTENSNEVKAATEIVMKICRPNDKSLDKSSINLEEFKNYLDKPELWGLTFLLRFRIPYLIKTKLLMERYLKKANLESLLNIGDAKNSLIPYFINEAYCPEELFRSMLHYSKNYANIQNLLQKMNEKNKISIVQYKGLNLFSNFANQIMYYLSEISFDIYNKESLFPLRNPIFLTLLITALAIIYPALFNNSSGFWNKILAFFSTFLPALFFISMYAGKKDSEKSLSDLPSDGMRDDYWLTNKEKYDGRQLEIERIESEREERSKANEIVRLNDKLLNAAKDKELALLKEKLDKETEDNKISKLNETLEKNAKEKEIAKLREQLLKETNEKLRKEGEEKEKSKLKAKLDMEGKEKEIAKMREQLLKETNEKLRKEGEEKEKSKLKAKLDMEAKDKEMEKMREQLLKETNEKLLKEGEEKEKSKLKAKLDMEGKEKEIAKMREQLLKETNEKFQKEAEEKEMFKLKAKLDIETKERERLKLKEKLEKETKENELAKLREQLLKETNEKLQRESEENERAKRKAKLDAEAKEKERLKLNEKLEKEHRDNELAKLREQSLKEAREKLQREVKENEILQKKEKLKKEAKEKEMLKLKEKLEREAKQNEQSKLKERLESNAKENEISKLKTKLELETKENEALKFKEKLDKQSKEQEISKLKEKLRKESNKTHEPSIDKILTSPDYKYSKEVSQSLEEKCKDFVCGTTCEGLTGKARKKCRCQLKYCQKFCK